MALYCLKPTYSLRNQLLLSFGTATAVVGVIFLITAVVCYQLSGKVITENADSLFRKQILSNLKKNNRYVAEVFSEFSEQKERIHCLVSEIVTDRIVGYPFDWEDDKFVPFQDMDTGRNMYPLKSNPLPLDWQIILNINETNKEEHLQERSQWFNAGLSSVSTASASYFMQGSCNPEEGNPTSLSYYENCTDVNNNVSSGGILTPSPTNRALYEKSADIGVLLKPIYESDPDILQIEIYYHNSGAGSVLRYPGSMGGFYDGIDSGEYISNGCEWMKSMNRTDKSLGTDEDIARCRPNGTKVSRREFNPNEISSLFLCENLTDAIQWDGPNYHQLDSNTMAPVMTLTGSVYDRMTNHFIGWVVVHISMQALTAFMTEYKLGKNDSDVAIISMETGQIYADTLNLTVGDPNVALSDTSFISAADYAKIVEKISHINLQKMNGLELEKVFSEWVLESEEGQMYLLYPLLPDSKETKNMIIHRVSNEIFNENEEIENGIQDEFRNALGVALRIIATGILFTFGFVFTVAHSLTKPFLWMERLAWGIVNHSDRYATGSIQYCLQNEPSISCKWLSAKEIVELVNEFRKMVNGFSGSGASRVANTELFEIQNKITWQSDFRKIYTKTSSENGLSFLNELFKEKNKEIIDVFQHDSKNGVKLDDEPSLPSTADNASNQDSQGSPSLVDLSPTQQNANTRYSVHPAPPKLRKISNIKTSNDKDRKWHHLLNSKVEPRKSSLFWSILLLIVLPLIIANLFAGIVITSSLSEINVYWLHEMELMSLSLEIKTLQSIVGSKANQVSATLQILSGHLHLLSRLSGWLAFDAINRSDAFPQTDAGSQECRVHNPIISTCPISSVCPCEWGDLDLYNLPCTLESDNSSMNLRRLQHRHMFGQTYDTDNIYGYADTPANTSWWSDFAEIPGADVGSDASGYITTYDRLRVLSAMAVLDIPLYNYAKRNRHEQLFVGSMVAFDNDGLGSGYRGCRLSYLEYPFFESTISNNASGIASNICPLGSFGYDPRCRRWYAKGKNSFLSEDRAPIDITAPYTFATNDFVGTSLTSPLADYSTNTYIGQILLDAMPFAPRILDGMGEAIAFIISVDDDIQEDTVIAPNGSNLSVPAAIGDLLLSYDDRSSKNRRDFEERVLPIIKNQTGPGKGIVHFFRRNNTVESDTSGNHSLAFALVKARALRPISVRDFSRGVEVVDVPTYVLCAAYDENFIKQPWEEMKEDVNCQTKKYIFIWACIVVSVTVLFFIFIYKATHDITAPMIMLLRIVKAINTGNMDHDIPPLHGGSREVHQVYASFAKLVRTVRMSNAAFFSGDLTWAYESNCDALKLFRTLNDEKATGVASSNLANTMHVIVQNAIYSDDCCNKIAGTCCIKSAITHYKESIAIAGNQLESAVGNDMKATFSQLLADRCFNYGLFLLLVYNESCSPVDAKEHAFEYIARARDLDHDVKDYLLAHKLLLKKSDEHFTRQLRRCLGLLSFFDDEELREIWDVGTLIQDAETFLVAAWDESSAPLFHNLSRHGRRQELESVAIRYMLCNRSYFEAASIAIRMMVEDTFLLDDAFKIAATALTEFAKDESSYCWTASTKTSLKSDLRKMLRRRKRIDVDVGKCIVFAFELNEKWDGCPILDAINSRSLCLYDECCFDDDLVGLVAYTSKEDLNVPLGLKSENEGIQRTSLDIATCSTNSGIQPTSLFAIQMIIDEQLSNEIDSFIVLVTDGFSFDLNILHSLKEQIQRKNEDRETQIHIFIIGLDLQDEDVVEEYKIVCSVSRLSEFFHVSTSNLGSAFCSIQNSIRGPLIGDTLDKGITMERF